MPDRIYGFSASAVAQSGANIFSNRFTSRISQSLGEAIKHGDKYRNRGGGVGDWQGEIGGIGQYNASSMAPQMDDYGQGTAAAGRAGAQLTLTVAPGCTLVGTAIMGEIAFDSQVDPNQCPFSHQYYGASADGPTETWDETA